MKSDSYIAQGKFRCSQSGTKDLYCATKWAIFEPICISKDVVEATISERLVKLDTTSIELVQFH